MSNKLGSRSIAVVAVLSASVASVGSGHGVQAVPPATASSPGAVEEMPPPMPTIELIASEHAFMVPARSVGGPVRVELDNEGGRVHMAQVWRIDGDRNVSDVVDLLRAIEDGNDPVVQPEWLHMIGLDFSPLGPGREFAVLTELEPGRYVAVCQLLAVNGSHASHGMVAGFEVVGSADAVMPTPNVTLVVDDDGFTLPPVPAGRRFVALRNDGEVPHQFEFGRLHEGSTFEDAVAFLQSGQVGELPADWAGGVIDVPPGETVVAEINLEAGEWSVVDVSDAGVMVGSLTVG